MAYRSVNKTAPRTDHVKEYDFLRSAKVLNPTCKVLFLKSPVPFAWDTLCSTAPLNWFTFLVESTASRVLEVTGVLLRV